jgi:hypothetical protein
MTDGDDDDDDGDNDDDDHDDDFPHSNYSVADYLRLTKY